MNRFIPLLLSLLTGIALSGCGGQNATSSPVTAASAISPSAAVPTEAPGVEDRNSLIIALRSAGVTAEEGNSVIQDFFTPEGKLININGQDIQVFEYESADAMESEASQVAPDGGSVGTSMMMWVDAPHFYKAGRIIVLYIGSDATVLTLLEDVLGAQFAGR